MKTKFTQRDIFAAGAIFLTSLSIYVYTLSPTLTFGDSGELITAAYWLGIAHPPGYPIWCLLGKLFTLIPVRMASPCLSRQSLLFWGLSSRPSGPRA
jgi:hypothetical protein